MTDPKPSHPEAIVAEALNYLVAHEPMLMRFFNLTGLTADTIREAAGDPGFYASVLDHVLADETLLTQFTQATGIRPEDVRAARHRLDGPDETVNREGRAGQRSALPRKTMFR